jgi:hypothetical protein
MVKPKILPAAVTAMTALLIGVSANAANAASAPVSRAAAATPQHVASAPLSVVTPDGQGVPVTLDCGTAQLIVTASNHVYQLILRSTKGVIIGGTYTVSTNGLGDIPVVGFVKVNGTATSVTTAGIPVPGINIGNAFANGAVETSQGWTCLFSVSAPWT